MSSEKTPPVAPVHAIVTRLPPHKCGLYLEHNPNRDVYDVVGQWVEQNDSLECPADWKDAEQKSRAIQTNELWTLQWYPSTPIGSHFIAAPTLEELLTFAAEYE